MLLAFDHVGWNSSKIISQLASDVHSLHIPTSWIFSKKNALKFWPEWEWGVEKVALGIQKL